ncbi:hypothetical protein KP79_PYT22933 [Mizuhopecten yessoensis]|uniref:ZP domain-containing protein n=2 Tax=Mizuhopecten yessoensis TaxID=6573 RepID=A0A210QXI4_MIZYE|nr:hypothetical protein KP79_PYT22933 [Mizuhopecten yessoensis]
MCTETALSLTLEGAENGGIIYIKGTGATCKQDTVNVTTELEFVFDACGIDPYAAFSVVVQKKPHYQTGNDIVVPVQCLYDFTIELSGSETVAREGVDEQGINVTVRPTATMTLYTNGLEVTAGQVDLTDLLTMSIQLGSEYIADLDLKAKYCTANTLEVIEDFCSTDTELFPNFVHPVQGVIATSFGAFRTTDLNGGVVDMVFSCTLQLCLGTCSQMDCANGESGYGRRKRFADNDEKGNRKIKSSADPDEQFVERRKKRTIDEDDIAFENMNVGAVIGVGNTLVIDETGDVTDDICIHVGLLVISGTLVVFLVIGCSVSMVSLFNKHRKGEAKKQPSKPEVTKTDVSVCTPASLSTSRFGTTSTRRFSGQFIPV